MTSRAVSERHYFWSALMFYTRIPVPKSAQHSQEILNRSRKYFPLIGLIISAIGVLVFALASLLFSTTLSVALSMAATLLATGAFHEDGFADSCDGLGGGWGTEQVLTIMKDSRVGTYATVGLFFLLSLKLLALVEIASFTSLLTFALVSMCAHSTSRQLSSMIIDSYKYVQDIDASKVKPITEQRLSNQDKRVSWFSSAVPLFALAIINPLVTILTVLAAATIAKLFMRYCKRRIGGYTGDILGAIQQLSELTFYLTVAAIPFN